ncbi:hypothetical protein N7527_000973 [Penicillium freii]|nr:hypothetical protein N7527_000973 [Penicillium freii]
MAWVIRPLVFWCGILLHVLNISTLLPQTNGITWASFCFLPCFYISKTVLLYLKRVASLVSLGSQSGPPPDKPRQLTRLVSNTLCICSAIRKHWA